MAVTARIEPRMIPTYPMGSPEKNPVFFEKRVYQGADGRVYPVPFIDKVHDEPRAVSYQAALEIVTSRRFHPWEGGEGNVLRQFTAAHLALGRRALDAGNQGSGDSEAAGSALEKTCQFTRAGLRAADLARELVDEETP